MSTLTSIIKVRIQEQLKKTIRDFDPELPDYVLLLLTNKKSKSELLKELAEFIARDKAADFVTWLYEEIESIKTERRVQKTPPKKEKKVKKKRKKSSKDVRKMIKLFR